MSVRVVCVAWQRHDLLSKHDRLLRLEKTHREQTIELQWRAGDPPVRTLPAPSFANARLRSTTPGTGGGWHLLRRRAQRGWQGVSANRAGLLQSPCLGTALYTSKLPVTSVHVLTKRYCCSSKPMRLGSIPSCQITGRVLRAPRPSSLRAVSATGGIEHRPPRYARPQSNGLSSDCIAHLLDEHFRIKENNPGMSR